MSDPDDTPQVGVSDLMLSAWGAGLMASAGGKSRADNPYPVDTEDWREWLRGFETWESTPKITITLPEQD